MLSALIPSRRGYPAVPIGLTTGAPEAARPRSSRTRGRSRQPSFACGG